MENRLPPDEYKTRCKEVLQRDGWRCRLCGRRNTLHVHHIVFRSRKGSTDDASNLITLCLRDHELVHSHKRMIVGNANGIVIFSWIKDGVVVHSVHI